MASHSVSKTVESGADCFLNLENIATACTQSIEIFKSESDLLTAVTHHLPAEGGSNMAVKEDSIFYYSGLDLTN